MAIYDLPVDSEIAVAEEDLARWVAAEVAPEEEELFGVISTAYRAEPGRFAPGAQSRDEVLGFGIETVGVLLTPVVLAAVTEVVRYLAEQVGGDVRSWLRRDRRAEARVPKLDDAQLDRVRGIVLEKCGQAGLAEDRSRLVADSVVGALGV